MTQRKTVEVPRGATTRELITCVPGDGYSSSSSNLVAATDYHHRQLELCGDPEPRAYYLPGTTYQALVRLNEVAGTGRADQSGFLNFVYELWDTELDAIFSIENGDQKK